MEESKGGCKKKRVEGNARADLVMIGHKGHPGEKNVQQDEEVVHAVLQQVIYCNIFLRKQHCSTSIVFMQLPVTACNCL